MYQSIMTDKELNEAQLHEKNFNQMTLKERFELIPELSKIFHRSQEHVTKYMMNTYVYLHVTDQQVSQHSGFYGETRQNASTVLVSLNYPLPNAHETRFKVVSITDEAELELLVRSFSYQIVQLASPYTDNCFNYQTIGFHSRNHARRNCSNEIVKAKKKGI